MLKTVLFVILFAFVSTTEIIKECGNGEITKIEFSECEGFSKMPCKIPKDKEVHVTITVRFSESIEYKSCLS